MSDVKRARAPQATNATRKAKKAKLEVENEANGEEATTETAPATPPPALTPGVGAEEATVARHEEPPAPPSMKLGTYTVPLPFECFCCPGFVTADENELLRHLAELNHHIAHTEFLAANAPIPQHEVDALMAFDLFSPPVQATKVALFLAKIIPTTSPRAPDESPVASGPSTVASSNAAANSTPQRLHGARTRSSSGSLTRIGHGLGSPGDEKLAIRLHEREMEGMGSPSKPTPGCRIKADATEGTLGVNLPWYDYVCNIRLMTEEQAQRHFEEPAHRQEVEAFLAKHQASLEAQEPATLKELLSTLPARPRPSLAERLATEDRVKRDLASSHRNALPLAGTTGLGTTSTTKLSKQEELGRWAAAFGRERTMPGRESSPEDQVYQVGVEETRQWQGNFAAMPLPAFCTLCNVRIPHEHQAVYHFEGSMHRSKVSAAGDKMIAKARAAGRSSALSDCKATFISKPPPSRRPVAPQATVEYPCAGADCRGRVLFPVGDDRASSRCNVCNFKQRPPVPVSPAKHTSGKN